MKLSINIAISIVFIAIFSGCVTGKKSLKTGSSGSSSLKAQDWEDRDISKLPVADDTEEIARIVFEISRRNSDSCQKKFALRLAQYAHDRDKKNKKAALALSYSAFILADSEESKSLRLKYANIGEKAAYFAGLKEKDPVACYYHALNLGLILQIKGLFALKKIPIMQSSLKVSLKSPETDTGGPLRTIGILYLKAPSWPTGIGDLDAALEHLEKAAVEYPAHPQNHLFFAEALLEDGDKEMALKYLEKAKNMAIPEIWGLQYTKKWLKEIEYLVKKASK